jgi:hypothetical protein
MENLNYPLGIYGYLFEWLMYRLIELTQDMGVFVVMGVEG